MANREPFSIRNRIRSFTHAFSGIWSFLKTEHNSWIHLAAAITAAVMGFLLNISNGEWCLVLIAIGLVFISEALNTAIEKMTDILSPGHNENAKKIKDISAGAVLIAAMLAVAVGAVIFVPKMVAFSAH
jgi:diacylglycerol kinase (ATP)